MLDAIDFKGYLQEHLELDARFQWQYQHRMCSAAATVVLVHTDADGVTSAFVGKRKETSQAYPGYWCFIGGMLDVGEEDLDETARRETREESGIAPSNRFRQFWVQSGPQDDPRAHVINVCYFVRVEDEERAQVKASDDIVDGRWVELHLLTNKEIEPLAFRHNEIAKRLLDFVFWGV